MRAAPDRLAASPSAIGLSALLLALAALVGACSDVEIPSAPGRGIYVQSSWSLVRQVVGHRVHVGKEQIECSKCHDFAGDAVGKVTPEACVECHEKESKLVHAQAEAEARFGAGTTSDCMSCHAFTVTSVAPSHAATGAPATSDPHAAPDARDCARCHLQQQGDTPAVRVHATNECVTCHKPHEQAKPASAPCTDCHGDQQTVHFTKDRTVNQICTTCHQSQHALAETARDTCADCHAKEQPVVPASALFSGGHTECVGCHQPHAFSKTQTVACRSCHEDVRVLGAPRVKAHEQCSSCHQPHDVKSSPERACQSCHRDKKPDHPVKGRVGTCVGCHDPHPPGGRTHTRAAACSSCHQTAQSDKAFHGGTDCKSCHTPHDFLRDSADRRACQSCHQKQLTLVSKLEGHRSCEGCHQGLPHRPAALAAGCGTCHQAAQKQVSRGHAECSSCHEPHAGTVGAACQSCHKTEHATAPAGHRDCKSCHQPHSGSTAAVSCAGCHAQEARSAHGKLQQGCNQCHRPHGPKGVAAPPACSTCHETKKLPGLHAEPKHQSCGTCHAGHGPTPGAARTACLSCHTAQKDHHPQAPNCASCHLFTATR